MHAHKYTFHRLLFLPLPRPLPFFEVSLVHPAMPKATALSFSTSSLLRVQDKALQLSSACAEVFAPGMGMVPCAMHQHNATCATDTLLCKAMSLQTASTASICGHGTAP